MNSFLKHNLSAFIKNLTISLVSARKPMLKAHTCIFIFFATALLE